MLAVIICIIVSIFVLLLIMQMKELKFGNIDLLIKALAIVYFSLCFVGIVLPDSYIKSVGDNTELLSNSNIYHSFLRIANAINPVILILATWLKGPKNKQNIFRDIAIWFVLPITIISMFSYSEYMHYFLDHSGRGLNNVHWLPQGFKDFLLTEGFRGTWLVLQWICALVIPFKILIFEEYQINFKRLGKALLVTLFLLFQMIPIYIPQLLFGYTNVIFAPFSLIHIIWMFYIISKIIIIYFMFRKSDANTKYVVCLVLALTVLFQYNSMFSLTINIKRLPLQLCNLASYLMLIAIITKNKHLFYFNFLVNVVGGTIALMIPDVNGCGIFEVWNMHFIYEHTNVIIVPILCYLFGMFPKIDRFAYRDAMIGFSSYFVFCLIVGTILNGIALKTGNDYFEVNYMFMFDKEALMKIVPFLAFLTKHVVRFGIFQIYPFLVLFVYGGYSLIITLFYFSFVIVRKIKRSIMLLQNKRQFCKL